MKKVIIALSVVVLLLSGCSTGNYVVRSGNSNINQTQVVLKENNFRVVRTVKTLYLYEQNNFWKTFKKKQLFESAYSKFLEEANLTGAQTVINVNMEETNRSSKRSEVKGIMVTGIVIEFTGEGH